jgi:CRP-like cAMP-binding protein
MFGEIDVLRNKPRRASFYAAADCYVLKIDKRQFRNLLVTFDDFRDDVFTIA